MDVNPKDLRYQQQVHEREDEFNFEELNLLPEDMEFLHSFAEVIHKAAQEHAAMTNKFTAQQVLTMSGILLSAEYKSTRMRSNKVSGWNMFLSEAKADIPDHIRCPTKGDGLRPEFTGEYTKVLAEQWPQHREEYMKRADILNKKGETLNKVSLALSQKRTINKLKMLASDLSCMGVSMIAYVVPSKSAHSLLLNNGVAKSYYSLIADTGRTVDEFRMFCESSHLQRRVKEVENGQAGYTGTVGRDAMRQSVNAKLLELLNNSRGAHPELVKLPRKNIIGVLTARSQTIKAPNDWPLVNRGSENDIVKTIFSRTVKDLQMTHKALSCGGLIIVKR